MRVVFHVAPSDVEFVEPGADGPYPYLLEVGELNIEARVGTPAGIASTEAPSIAVGFSNCENRASSILGWPLRLRVDIYDDANEIFFSGSIASFSFAKDTGSIEVGS